MRDDAGLRLPSGATGTAFAAEMPAKPMPARNVIAMSFVMASLSSTNCLGWPQRAQIRSVKDAREVAFWCRPVFAKLSHSPFIPADTGIQSLPNPEAVHLGKT